MLTSRTRLPFFDGSRAGALAGLVLTLALSLLLPVRPATAVCGDVTGDGFVDLSDSDAIRLALVGLPAGLTVPEACNVSGPAGASDVNGDGLPDDCDLVDITVLRRDLAGRPPGIADLCCEPPGAVDAAGECCLREQIQCGNGLCQPTLQCRHGVCSGGVCSCDEGWISPTCGAQCDGGQNSSFCGSPLCSGKGNCEDQPVRGPLGGAFSCYVCSCDEIFPGWGFGGDLCQFSGCGVDSAGRGGFVTELESLYSCGGVFGTECNTLPLDFFDTDPGTAFTIEFQVRRRGPWEGYTILSKWGCSSTPAICSVPQFTDNWRVEIGDSSQGALAGGKVRFGPGGLGMLESNTDLVVADGGLDLYHHIAITYDCCDPTTSGLTIYVDGVFDSFFSKASVGIFFSTPNRGNVYVLDDRTPGGPNFANVDLDEVRIWNVRRTQEEINATMLTEVDPSDPRLLYYLRFNESVEEAALTDMTKEYANGWETRIVGSWEIETDAMFHQFSPVFAVDPLPGTCSTESDEMSMEASPPVAP